MLLLVYDEQSSDRWLPRVRFFTLMRRMRTGENVARNERRKKYPPSSKPWMLVKFRRWGKFLKFSTTEITKHVGTFACFSPRRRDSRRGLKYIAVDSSNDFL